MGCDLELLYTIYLLNSFNPRTRMGCDIASLFFIGKFIPSFNPRTRMGCDQ